MTGPARLTHTDAAGRVAMVDVGAKPPTRRVASASGRVRCSESALAAIRDGTARKGDVLTTARLAGIMAAKRTAELIPLCHPLALTHIEVTADLVADPPAVALRATVRCQGPTGVEMEALTAVAVAALTVIDMIKAVDPWAVIEAVQVEEKAGGRSGTRRRGAVGG